MAYKVNSADNYTLSLQQDSKVFSVLQNIAMLLNTKRGTVPMYRDFGLPMEFVDKPFDVAENMAYVEISDAIEEFEPRAKLEDVYFEKTENGKISITVEVSINDEQSD
ncbi:MAG: GPW/gp25 family protein [Oscillospiraceae bacterium]